MGILKGGCLGAVIVGVIGFSIGFIGPIIFTPEANQGPLLGIFITGAGEGHSSMFQIPVLDPHLDNAMEAVVVRPNLFHRSFVDGREKENEQNRSGEDVPNKRGGVAMCRRPALEKCIRRADSSRRFQWNVWKSAGSYYINARVTALTKRVGRGSHSPNARLDVDTSERAAPGA